MSYFLGTFIYLFFTLSAASVFKKVIPGDNDLSVSEIVDKLLSRRRDGRNITLEIPQRKMYSLVQVLFFQYMSTSVCS